MTVEKRQLRIQFRCFVSFFVLFGKPGDIVLPIGLKLHRVQVVVN